MSFTITATSPDAPDAIILIGELETQLDPLYPRASRHGLSVAQLLDQGVAFFLIRSEGEPVGCGGVKLVGADDGDYGEVKRMYVRPPFRGRGLAREILDHLALYALAQGVTLLRLETGIHQHDAIALYERWGFTRISPFGEYKEDPLSLFFEKRITAGG
jgi:GNAT superfamily N-acetyltransferase